MPTSQSAGAGAGAGGYVEEGSSDPQLEASATALS